MIWFHSLQPLSSDLTAALPDHYYNPDSRDEIRDPSPGYGYETLKVRRESGLGRSPKAVCPTVSKHTEDNTVLKVVNWIYAVHSKTRMADYKDLYYKLLIYKLR